MPKVAKIGAFFDKKRPRNGSGPIFKPKGAIWSLHSKTQCSGQKIKVQQGQKVVFFGTVGVKQGRKLEVEQNRDFGSRFGAFWAPFGRKKVPKGYQNTHKNKTCKYIAFLEGF